MKWTIPLPQNTYPSIELQVPDDSISPDLLKRMYLVADDLQNAYAAASRFERGLTPHPKSFAHDLDGTH